MIKWCDFVWSISNGPIVRPPQSPNFYEAFMLRGFTFGDWVPPVGDDRKSNQQQNKYDECFLSYQIIVPHLHEGQSQEIVKK